MGVAERLRNLDTHSSVSKEFRVYTIQGAVLSVVTIIAIVYLVGTELKYNFQTTIRERVHVNASSPVGLDVEFDISLPQVPCSLLNIDANDPTGQLQSLHLDRQHHVWKHRIKLIKDENGNNDDLTKFEFIGDRTKLELGSTFLKEDHLKTQLEEKYNITAEEQQQKLKDGEVTVEEECGSCYGAGAEGECCDTCDDVKRAYNRRGWHLQKQEDVVQCRRELAEVQNDDGEGCNVHGIVALSTGGGSFHLAPGRSLDQMNGGGGGGSSNLGPSIFDILMKTFEQWNVSHTVHKLRFGAEYPGHIHQLDGVTRNIGDSYGMYQYYFQVVPTLYRFLNGTTIQTNQFSVTEHLRHVNPGGGRGLPGVFFFYEISPLHVEIVEDYQQGWIAFFTSVCAIVGGVVTVMGLVDQYLHSQRNKQDKGSGANMDGGLIR